MKTPTIWESASRPLFVRTVWLDGSYLRRGLQRHFLLDYETKRPLERLKLAVNPLQHRRKENLKPRISYDIPESEELYNSDDDDGDAFHIDSAKVKLHEPVKAGNNKSSGKITITARRRSSVLSRKFQSYDSYHSNSKSANSNRRTSDLTDLYSRRSSLQDLASEKLIAADERLAERVLNWLDLAGNEDFLKNLNDLKDMEVKLTKATKLRTDSIKRSLSKNFNPNNNSFNIPKVKIAKPKPAPPLQGDICSPRRHLRGADAIKHITIIFNKEGQPIRFNRPAKNIDLCALSASPSTTRRLAGTLASARLYKSAENSRLNTERSRVCKLKEAAHALSARRRLDTVADLTNSTLQKRLQENPLMGSYNNLHDSKKQLHIFMPTLPKKGLSMGAEDGVSELSQNLSENCKV